MKTMRLTTITLPLSFLIALPCHGDVALDLGSYRLEGGDPFPQCQGAWNTETGARDCPRRMTVRGFPVYISAHVEPENAAAVGRWIDMAEGTLERLESSEEMRSHFVEGLKHAGVGFYLTGSHETDPFTSRYANYYDAGRRLVHAKMYFPFPFSWRRFENTFVHELVHAYHDIYLRNGFGNRCVKQAFRYSVEVAGKYEGAYAARNDLEYFAEIATYWLGYAEGSYCEDDDQEWPCDLGVFYDNNNQREKRLPVQNKWLLAKYDYNAAMLYKTFFLPQFQQTDRIWRKDPRTFPMIEENSLDCDPAKWWPARVD